MNQYEIQPFFFPTTVAFVDDSADFLANLTLQLEPRLAFRLFDSPSAAMKGLDGSDVVPHPVQSFFSLYKQHQDNSVKHRVIELSLESIHKTVHNRRRFEQISVAVVDFDMPMMSGLEFCRNIENPAIRKILLTGKADERIAVKAFNEGIIDCFILKQDEEAMQTLNREIKRMQQLYFSEIEGALSDMLMLGTSAFLGSHGFFRDPVFVERFFQIRSHLDIVEYYLSCTPDGILMLDASGTAYFLFVRTAGQWLAHYEVACNQEAPPELLTALFNGEAVPHFWEADGTYSSAYHDWRASLHLPSAANSDDFYIYTVVKNPSAFNLESVLPYQDYLNLLDDNVLNRF